MTFKVSDKQQEAIDLITDWYHSGHKQSFFLSGRAGTGKTTIIAQIMKQLGIHRRRIHAACPTGKAVNVLSESLVSKGLDDIEVSTIHGLMYYPAPTQIVIDASELASYRRRGYSLFSGEGSQSDILRELVDADAKNVVDTNKVIVERLEFTRKPKEKLESLRLVIVDEASMVTWTMHREILSYGIKVLFVGDTAQLPPVERNIRKVDVLGEPDVQLLEIFRQGKDSMIIQLANDIFDGKPIYPGTYGKNGEVVIMTRSEFENNQAFKQQAYFHADQIICGYNATRHRINHQVRELKGFSGSKYPVVGDKVISLKNNRNLYVAGSYLVNGSIGYITEVDNDLDGELDKLNKLNKKAGKKNSRAGTIGAKFVPLDTHISEATSLLMSTVPFDDPDFDKGQMYRSSNNYFDYGYAITCHKSQGSQWDDVLIIEEQLPNSHNTHRNWLYTAVTRAKERVILVISGPYLLLK